MDKKAQSEMVGFALIVIIVAVIIMIFVYFSIQQKTPTVQNYKTESFVQSMLQYTTTCQYEGSSESYLELINLCGGNGLCDSGENACHLLNSTSAALLNASWQVGSEFPIRGYDFSINDAGKDLVSISKGNSTLQSQGSNQVFSGGIQITFKAYY